MLYYVDQWQSMPWGVSRNWFISAVLLIEVKVYLYDLELNNRRRSENKEIPVLTALSLKKSSEFKRLLSQRHLYNPFLIFPIFGGKQAFSQHNTTRRTNFCYFSFTGTTWLFENNCVLLNCYATILKGEINPALLEWIFCTQEQSSPQK